MLQRKREARMKWKIIWKAGEMGKYKVAQWSLRVKTKDWASLWRLELESYSQDLEENSWRTNFSHMEPAAALLLGLCLPAAESVPSSQNPRFKLHRPTASDF